MQLISGVCSVVNGGTLYKPYFVQSVDSAEGVNVATRLPEAVRRTVSEETSRKMREYLVGVVANGGGSKAGVAGYAIGGKTGTAQKYAGGGGIAQGKYVSSFIGFAPANDPKYAVLMIVDEPQGYMYYGSLVAAPYAGSVFKKIFDYEDIAPTALPETEYVAMPDVVGETPADAVAILARRARRRRRCRRRANARAQLDGRKERHGAHKNEELSVSLYGYYSGELQNNRKIPHTADAKPSACRILHLFAKARHDEINGLK